MDDLVEYFDATYIHGQREAVQHQDGQMAVNIVQPALFPINTWNVHQSTLTGASRTNNLCEAWNSR